MRKTNTNFRRNPWQWLLTVALVVVFACGFFTTKTALAFRHDLNDTYSLNVDTRISYGAAMRVEEQSDTLLANINRDDGNRSFDQWDLFNNRFSIMSELDLQGGNWGVFMRGRGFFDMVYTGESHNDSPSTHNNHVSNGGSLTDHQDFSDATEDRHGRDAELLDAFIYSDFEVGGNNVILRFGRQVVSWGESMFIQNSISAAQSPLDATMTNAPGVELKDVFLPTGQAYGQVSLLSNFTVAGFYQWEWDQTRLDEAGSYFSTADTLLDAGERILVNVAPGVNAAIDRAEDQHARDDGQWGAAFRMVAPGLNHTEFGLYYINYHEKLPRLQSRFGGGKASPAMIAAGGDWGNIIPDPMAAARLNMVDMSSYYLVYPEDVKLIGASACGVIADANVAIEASYRMDYPVAVLDSGAPLGQSYETAELLQVQASVIYLMSGMPWTNDFSIRTEWGYNRVVDVSENRLANDKYAWGGTVQLLSKYYNVFPSLDLEIPVTFRIYPEGVSSANATFVEGADSVGVTFDFTYMQKVAWSVGYVAFVGSASDDAQADRDYVTFSLKYTF